MLASPEVYKPEAQLFTSQMICSANIVRVETLEARRPGIFCTVCTLLLEELYTIPTTDGSFLAYGT